MTTTTPKVGDRLIYLGKIKGTITRISKGLMKYEILWDGGRAEGYTQKEFNRLDIEICSYNSTSAQASVLASPMPQLSLEVSTLSESAKQMNGAALSSSSDSQQLTTTEMCKLSTHQDWQWNDSAGMELSLLPLPAPHSQLKANGKELMTAATVSPQLPTRSPLFNQDSLQSKMSPDCSTVPTNQEPATVTSGTFWATFPSSGSIVNGLMSAQDTLAPPFVESGYCWLESGH